MATTTVPVLAIRFVIDEAGNPEFVKTPEMEHKHYKLNFEVENAPADAYAATFILHESYYDPVRTVRPDRDGHLRLSTTSYGDYDVKVHLRTPQGELQLVDTVTGALKRARSSMPPGPAVDEAIAYLEER